MLKSVGIMLAVAAFFDYEGDKEFIVKGYVDASFDTYPDDSE